MAGSTSLDFVGIGGESPVAGIAFEVDVTDSNGTPQSVPKRVRRRLLEAPENKPRTPSSLEEIEAKLKEADLRRQQFHEWLANKARPKPRSPTRSANPEDLAQRLEAKLSAAEQKRLELLAQAQMRLAKSDELRQAAKTEVQLRAEREREELESKVESRVQQAEINRMALDKQRRAAAQERMAHSLLHRMLQEDKDKERMETLYATICQRVAAAEEKRLGLLEAEKTRAHAIVMQARKVANSVCIQREMEIKNLKEKLENRLQRAKRKRAELLRQRGRCGGISHINHHKMYKHGDRLSRKLARVWRQFQRSRRTTYALAQEFTACEISHSSVNSVPFEQLAARIQSTSTLQAVKALLARIESRFLVSQARQSNVAQIDHLLKRLSPGHKKMSSPGNRAAKMAVSQVSNKGTTRGQNVEGKELLRYPVRVFLCAYMILGHPEAVFSGRGDRETALAEAAARLIPEFESLITIILDGPSSSSLSRPSSPNAAADDWGSEEPQTLSQQRPFAAQLAAFDAAWCSYLYQFVLWKVKDAQSLEDDLIRVACQLEVSMLQKCKITSGDEDDASHDSKAIRKQVLEDQQLLRERVLHLSGSDGATRMKMALSDARAKFMESKENGTLPMSPFYPASFSPSHSPSDVQNSDNGKPKKVARSLFKNTSEPETSSSTKTNNSSNRLGDALEAKLLNDNEIMLNDILHDRDRSLADILCGINKGSDKIKAQVKSTMEKAFWNGVEESLAQDHPDYNWVVGLVKEVRDELLSLIPESWKQELLDSIDVELLSQILESGSQDIEYLSKLLDYSLGVVLKLALPANDNESKAAHEKLFHELSEIVAGMDKNSNRSFARALVKGLRFILEQIQVLKQHISAARIRALEPLVQGSAGVSYLQQAFTTCYGSSPGATTALPQTVQWLTLVRQSVEQQRSEFEALSTDFRNSQPSGSGLPPVTSLRTGGQLDFGKSSPVTSANVFASPCCTGSSSETTPHEIKWNSIDTLIRLGLLQLASKPDAANEETTPETLKLNIRRLQKAQNDIQHIIVIATSMLLVRQTLAAKGVPAAELDTILRRANKQLNDILSNPAISIHHIGHLLSQICLPSGEKDEANQELMTRILRRSLSADDVVFVRVSTAICSAIRAILLIGKCLHGRSLAELALKRIGAVALVDQLVRVADDLDIMATVTCQVHGPWYSCIAREM